MSGRFSYRILFPFMPDLSKLAADERSAVQRSRVRMVQAIWLACLAGILAFVGFRLAWFSMQVAAFLVMVSAIVLWWIGMFVSLRTHWRVLRRR
jgi:hypothetical protein